MHTHLHLIDSHDKHNTVTHTFISQAHTHPYTTELHTPLHPTGTHKVTQAHSPSPHRLTLTHTHPVIAVPFHAHAQRPHTHPHSASHTFQEMSSYSQAHTASHSYTPLSGAPSLSYSHGHTPYTPSSLSTPGSTVKGTLTSHLVPSSANGQAPPSPLPRGLGLGGTAPGGIPYKSVWLGSPVPGHMLAGCSQT